MKWITTQSIPEGGCWCFAKAKSWLRGEGVLLAEQDWILEQPTNQITTYGLAKAVGGYLDSKKAASTVVKISSLGREGAASVQRQCDVGSTSWGWFMSDTKRKSMLMATREMWFFIAMRYFSHAGNCFSDRWLSSRRVTVG